MTGLVTGLGRLDAVVPSWRVTAQSPGSADTQDSRDTAAAGTVWFSGFTASSGTGVSGSATAAAAAVAA